MAFSIKEWKDRLTEYPNRRILTKEDGTTEIVTVSRSEGEISQEGDAFSADNMNDLEQRIADEFSNLNSNLELDFSNATPSVQDVNTLLQKLLNRFYSNVVDLMKELTFSLVKFDGNNGGTHTATFSQTDSEIQLVASGVSNNNSSGLIKSDAISFAPYNTLTITVSLYYQSGDSQLYDEKLGFGEILSTSKGGTSQGWTQSKKISSSGTYTFDISDCDSSKTYQIGFGYVLNNAAKRQITITKIELS